MIVPRFGQPLWVSGLHRDLALSPDGRHLVYAAGASDDAKEQLDAATAGTGSALMVRSIEDNVDAQPIAGVASASGPFFSPDGRWIGFFDGFQLRKMSITGGPAITLCQLKGVARGASWADDNTIVFATDDVTTGLLRVSAGGGKPTLLTTPEAAEHDDWFPFVLPGGHGVLFTITGSRRHTEYSEVASRPEDRPAQDAHTRRQSTGVQSRPDT